MNNTEDSQNPTFISLEEAIEMKTGTRITFVPGVQALYAEALKNICYVKMIHITRVLHPLMGTDKETGEDRQSNLYKLTKQKSLPTMLHDEERPRNVWIEQLALAEQIGSSESPSIIPESFELRAEMYGLCAIILAEDGLVWNMRILNDGPLGRKYGYSEAASSSAPAKIVDALKVINKKLESQKKLGSQYLIGNKLSAVDIYWATMSMCMVPAAEDIMPKTRQNQGMLAGFEAISKIPDFADVISPLMEAHQRYILKTYCETPAILGGDSI